MKIFTNVMAILLGLTMLLSACASNKNIADDFVAAAASMSGEKNADTTIRLELLTSDTAERKSFKGIVSEATNNVGTVSVGETFDDGMHDVNIAIELLVQNNIKNGFNDEEGTYFEVNWIGPDTGQANTPYDSAPIIEFYVTEQAVYIGTSITEWITEAVGSYIPGIDGLNSVLGDYYWISASYDELETLTGQDITGQIPGFADIDTEYLNEVSEKILETFKGKYGDKIMKDKDVYTLELDGNDLTELFADICGIIINDPDKLREFLLALAVNNPITDSDVNVFLETMQNNKDAIADISDDVKEALNDISASISVSATGKGDSREQITAIEIYIPENVIDQMDTDSVLALQILRMKLNSETRIRNTDEYIPGGKSSPITITEFIDAFMPVVQNGGISPQNNSQ